MNERNMVGETGAGFGALAISASEKSCFVIMPFSKTTEDHTEEYWCKFYTDFLEPAIKTKGFSVHRSEARTGKISKDIVQDIAYSDLVVAVLTDNNPNVWYELGVRHTSRLGTIMAIEEGQNPSFDVRDYGIIFYDSSNCDRFNIDLERHVASIPRKDSPVADFLRIDSNIAVNVAVGTLRHSVRLLSEAHSRGGWEEVDRALKDYQTSLPRREIQVSVVEGEEFRFHADKPPPALSECWLNIVQRDVAFLPVMRRERNGVRIGSIKDYEEEGRMTVIAFETLHHPQCLVVAEAHYWQEGPRPY